MPPRPSVDALRGSLDLLVLKTLSLVSRCTAGGSASASSRSRRRARDEPGLALPALQRLEKEGLITSEWGVTDNNRQARYYRITAAGRRALGNEVESWRRFAAALERCCARR